MIGAQYGKIAKRRGVPLRSPYLQSTYLRSPSWARASLAPTPNNEEEIREASQELMRQFKETNGSLLCRELLGYHLLMPKEREKAKESSVFNKVCPLLVKDATELAVKIMRET